MSLISDPRLTADQAATINARARIEGPRGKLARASFARKAGVGPKQADRWFSPVPRPVAGAPFSGREFPLLPRFLIGRPINATLPDGMRYRLHYGFSLLTSSEIGMLTQEPYQEDGGYTHYHYEGLAELPPAIFRAQQYRIHDTPRVDDYLSSQWFEMRIIPDKGVYELSIAYIAGVSPPPIGDRQGEDTSTAIGGIDGGSGGGDREAEEEDYE